MLKKPKRLAKRTHKRAVALILCAAMMASLGSFVMPAQADAGGKPVDFEDLYIREADKNTMDSYIQASLGGLIYTQAKAGAGGLVDGVSTATVRNNFGSRYAGEVWSDLSVFARYSQVRAKIMPFEAEHVYNSDGTDAVKSVYEYKDNAWTYNNDHTTTELQRALDTLHYWLGDTPYGKIDFESVGAARIKSDAELRALLENGKLTAAQAAALNGSVNKAIDLKNYIFGHDGDFDLDKLYLGSDTDGITAQISMSDMADFLNVFSLLGSSQILNDNVVLPLDVVFVLDTSSSMASHDSGSMFRLQKAAAALSEAFETVMTSNELNRLALLTYDTNVEEWLPLDRYEPVKGRENMWKKGDGTPRPDTKNKGEAESFDYPEAFNNNYDKDYLVYDKSVIGLAEYDLPMFDETGKKRQTDNYGNDLRFSIYQNDCNNEGSQELWENMISLLRYVPGTNSYSRLSYQYIQLNVQSTTQTDDDGNPLKYTDWINMHSGTNTHQALYSGLYTFIEDNEIKTATVNTVFGQKEVPRVPVVILVSDGAPSLVTTTDSNATGSGDGNGFVGNIQGWWEPTNPKNPSSSNTPRNLIGAPSYNGWGTAIPVFLMAAYMKNKVSTAYKDFFAERKLDGDAMAIFPDVQIITVGVDSVNSGDPRETDLMRTTLDPNGRLNPEYIENPTNRDADITSTDYTERIYESLLLYFGEEEEYSIRRQNGINNLENGTQIENGTQYFYSFKDPDDPDLTDSKEDQDERNRRISDRSNFERFDVRNNGLTFEEHKLKIDNSQRWAYLLRAPDYIDAVIDWNTIIYNNAYYDAAADSLGTELFNVISRLKFTGTIFAPVTGTNAAGVVDSLTYVNPIGRYMAVDSVTDVTVFGRRYAVGRYGVYDYDVNEELLKNTAFRQTNKLIREGWYKETANATEAEKTGAGAVTAGGYIYYAPNAAIPGVTAKKTAWDLGFTYHVTYLTAQEFIPTLAVIENKEDMDAKQKNTAYTLYRITGEYDDEGNLQPLGDATERTNLSYEIQKDIYYHVTDKDGNIVGEVENGVCRDTNGKIVSVIEGAVAIDGKGNIIGIVDGTDVKDIVTGEIIGRAQGDKAVDNDGNPIGTILGNLSAGTKPIVTFDLLNDIRMWVEDTGEYRDMGVGDFVVDSDYREALYVDIGVNALPTQVARIDLNPENFVPIRYKTNLNQTKASTPLRIFYGTRLDPEYLRYDADGNPVGVALTDIASEYIEENTADYMKGADGYYDEGSGKDAGRYTAFYSNFFTDSVYDKYPVMQDSNKGSRGNPTLSFSVGQDNQFYRFQKDRVLYLIPGSYGLKERPAEIDLGALAETYYTRDDNGGCTLYYYSAVEENGVKTEYLTDRAGNPYKFDSEKPENRDPAVKDAQAIDPTDYNDLQLALNAYRANLDGKGAKSTYWAFGDCIPVNGSENVLIDGNEYSSRLTQMTAGQQEKTKKALMPDFEKKLKDEGKTYQPQISSDNWYYIIREFYSPVSFEADGVTSKDVAVRYMAIPRMGSEFGSGIASGEGMGAYVEWYHAGQDDEFGKKGDVSDTFNEKTEEHYGHPAVIDHDGADDIDDLENGHIHTSGWYVAAKPGGLRVGGLANFAGVKGYDVRAGVSEGDFEKAGDALTAANVTDTARTYFLPTISSFTQGTDADRAISGRAGGGDEPAAAGIAASIVVNEYLGNNGRILVNDTRLVVTKTVSAAAGEPSAQTELFRFEITIQGYYGERGAVLIMRDEFNSDLWRRRFDTIDLLTDNRRLLLGDDSNLAMVDAEGERVVKAVGEDGNQLKDSGGKLLYYYAAKDSGGEVIRAAKEDGTATKALAADKGKTLTQDEVYYVYVGTNLRAGRYNDKTLRVFKADVVESDGVVDPTGGDIYGNGSMRGGRTYYLTAEQYNALDDEIKAKGAVTWDGSEINAGDLTGVEEKADLTKLSKAIIFHIVGKSDSRYLAGDREFWVNKVYLVPVQEVDKQDENTAGQWEWQYGKGREGDSSVVDVNGQYPNEYDFGDNLDSDSDWRTGYCEGARVDSEIIRASGIGTGGGAAYGKYGEYKLLPQFNVAHIRKLADNGNTTATELASNNGFYITSTFLTTQVTFENTGNGYGKATVWLSDGQGLGFNNIGNGNRYTVAEMLTADQTGKGFAFRQVDHVQGKGTRTSYAYNNPVAGGTSAYEQAVHYFNSFKSGGLTVSKTVAGSAGDTAKYFHFTVTLDDDSINGTYGGMVFTNGVASFTLKHGESKTAAGLPAGITYTVAEAEADKDGYTTTASGEKGEITSGDLAVAKFTNTKGNEITTEPDPDPEPGPEPPTGSLTVSKTVNGSAGDTTKDFHFTVTLDDDSISGEYGEMNFKDGEASFTLKHGESKTAAGLPAGVGYSVTEAEAGQDGYVTAASGENGTIPDDGVAAADFTNTKEKEIEPGAGTLTVSKTVVNGYGEVDEEREFTFTVTLTPPDDAEWPEDLETAYTFTLRHGQSWTIEGLPAGTKYTVTEADADGYAATASGENGTIPDGGVAAADFTNTKEKEIEPGTGNLTVSKTVAGNSGDRYQEFHFTVTLGDSGINGTYGDMTFVNGVAEITLRDGMSKTAAGLPAGVGYSVTEAEANQDGYVTAAGGDTGTVPDGEAAVAGFTNTKDVEIDPGVGNLVVRKVVGGDTGDRTRQFNFAVVLSDSTVNGTYGGMTFVNGVAHFTLRHGESRTAAGLPAGVTYSVMEAEANQDGYTTASKNRDGTIPEQGSVQATFNNTRGELLFDDPPLEEFDDPEIPLGGFPNFPDFPQTGDNRHPVLWLTLMILSAIGLAFTVFFPGVKRNLFSAKGRHTRK